MTPPPNDRRRTITDVVVGEHVDRTTGKLPPEPVPPVPPHPKASPVAAPAPQRPPVRVESAPESAPRSMSPPGGLKAQFGPVRVALPASVAAALAALLTAAVTRLTAAPPVPAKTTETEALVAAERAACGERLGKLEVQVAELRETQARTAGWLQGALSRLGLQASTAPGAEQLTVTSQPEPLGARAPRRVTIDTPIPAPAPRR